MHSFFFHSFQALPTFQLSSTHVRLCSAFRIRAREISYLQFFFGVREPSRYVGNHNFQKCSSEPNGLEIEKIFSLTIRMFKKYLSILEGGRGAPKIQSTKSIRQFFFSPSIKRRRSRTEK